MLSYTINAAINIHVVRRNGEHVCLMNGVLIARGSREHCDSVAKRAAEEAVATFKAGFLGA